MQVELTKDAKFALATIYKVYLLRLQEGRSKKQAQFFDNNRLSDEKLITFVRESISELTRAEMIKTDICGGFELLPKAIIYMENRPKETIKEWLSFAAQFKP